MSSNSNLKESDSNSMLEKEANGSLIASAAPETMNDKEKEDIDYILNKIVGGGDGADWAQWLVLIAISPIGFCAAFPLFMHLFACYEPRHRCYVHNCDTHSANSSLFSDNSTSTLNQPGWLSIAIPTNHTSREMLKSDEAFDPCNQYSAIGKDCTPSSFNSSSIEKCERYIYDQSVVTESFTTRFNLVCDAESQQMVLGVMVMVGLMLGSLIGGKLSDRYGRQRVMIGCVLVIVPTVMFAGYSKDFWTYAVLKFICTVALPCVWVSNHSLITEIFATEYRRTAVVVKELLWPIAGLALVAIFYLTRHWTYFHLWTGIFCALALPPLIIIPESPRWLSINRQSKKAEQVLLKIARWNQRNISDEQHVKLSSILKQIETECEQQHEKDLGFLDMIRSKTNQKKTFIIMLNWIIVCVSCFTLALNVTKLSGNVFVNTIMLSLLGDIPGKVLVGVTLKYFSRRLNLFLCQFLVGVFCTILAFLPKEYTFAVVSLFLLAMNFSNATFTLVYLITGEIYPTNLRSQAIGICSMAARAFAISAPFISKLASTWRPLPLLVLGIPSICIALLVYFLPETKQTHLPQTMEEAEQI